MPHLASDICCEVKTAAERKDAEPNNDCGKKIENEHQEALLVPVCRRCLAA